MTRRVLTAVAFALLTIVAANAAFVFVTEDARGGGR
jgi:hypothetical protein